ncbi:MAG TPA: DUF3857 and transglutaminase domain-containing protein [Acidobacteriaceae bacterium]|jgi:hypothetical protein|nr:DUF3857 and transglutaminase domain-containing protein [Acidobacteriaceae bacterium]
MNTNPASPLPAATVRSNRIPHLLQVFLLLAAVFAPVIAAHADDFTPPTKEELQMTSLPGYPGVPAVVLYREEITKDDLHEVLHYDRIKILTEEGKKYANVELGYVSTSGSYDDPGDDKSLSQIEGRTIHADGTIVPFTGKPYLKVMAKEERDGIQGKYEAKIFTLPDVQVGSIIEYRYATRINDDVVEEPYWIIQGDLYVKSAHFMWYPTIRDVEDPHFGPITSITWFPILPAGAKIDHKTLPPSGFENRSQQIYELNIKDVPPIVDEEYMPPMASYSYRVLFNFSPFQSAADYWKSEGKDWSKRANSFANPNSDLRSQTETITAGATTDDQKLRKIYAAVMALENTDFTREHEAVEDKENGLGKLKDADDVLKHKRGNSTQLTELFVGMARAAGMKADLMRVPDRSQHIFTQYWLSFEQFDDLIAIVGVDGKEQYFDPGSRYCPYAHLAWEHTFVQGLRQTGNDTAFAQTLGDGYAGNRIARVANLTMDDHGQLTGRIDMTYVGQPALHWRQVALRGDQESLKHSLRSSLENLLPKSIEVKDVTIDGLDDYEQPLKVGYTVSGTLGTRVGKRLIMPADLFLSDAQATFPHEKRELAVYFHYPEAVQDALRINFPSGFSIEAVPSNAQFNLPQFAAYNMSVAAAPTNFTTRRVFALGEILILPAEYPKLRTFYSQFEANDQQSVVLKASAALSSTASPAGN